VIYRSSGVVAGFFIFLILSEKSYYSLLLVLSAMFQLAMILIAIKCETMSTTKMNANANNAVGQEKTNG
jgi:NADH:ubiquinone oxidoreductase subunit 6 (subunit J)